MNIIKHFESQIIIQLINTKVIKFLIIGIVNRLNNERLILRYIDKISIDRN
jgi:hypothetical protein